MPPSTEYLKWYHSRGIAIFMYPLIQPTSERGAWPVRVAIEITANAGTRV